MTRDGDHQRHGDHVFQRQVDIGCDQAEKVVSGVYATVCGQRQKFGSEGRARGGAGQDSLDVGEGPEHLDDDRRLLAKDG
ncbi:Uncharacterised protein [Mycobacteroides abscessus subsp. massiliense]|nr:Uncharacterised protein [Mycobacteroides abscessus subsp. massiliense]